VAHQVVTPVSPGASRLMLAAEAVVEAVVWKEGEVKESAGNSWQVVASGQRVLGLEAEGRGS
jgi:hypothetical protein